MNETVDKTHVMGLISEYVLDLLPREETIRVARHLASCETCHKAMTEERKMTRSVRGTLQLVSAPDPERLRRLMPVADKARQPILSHFTLAPSWTAVALLLLIALGVMGLYLNQPSIYWSFEGPTASATAVLMTDTPTQQVTRDMTATAKSEALSPHADRARLPVGRSELPEITPVLAPVPAAPLYH